MRERSKKKKTIGIKRIWRIMIVACAFAAFAGGQVFAADGLLPDYTNKTVVLMSNDVHGAINGYQYMAGLRDELVRRHADVIVVDSGDYIQGSVEVSATKGANAIRMMNKVGYDLATLGNHEFDYSYAKLQELISMADFDVVSDDIVSVNGGFAFGGTKIITGDVNVGFVGITTPEAKVKSSPSILDALVFLDNKTEPAIFDQTASDIARLDLDGADVILCVAHLGVDEESAPYRSYDLWETVKDKGLSDKLDYILDGHSHTVMTEGEKGEPIISTGERFQNIGVITIDETTGKLDQNAKPYLYEVTKDSYTNAAVKAESEEIAKEIDEIYGVKVGTSEVNLNGARNAKEAAEQGLGFKNGNRDGETNMGDFVSDALRWYALKDGRTYDVPEDHIIGLYNGGSMRAGISEGDITRGDVLKVSPFANPVYGIYVTGAQLLEALEASTFRYPDEGAGFPHVSGMEYTINTGIAYQPAASTYPASTYYPPAEIKRITINDINGKPFSATDKYLVVSSQFIVDGGDTYGAFREIPRIAIADLEEELFGTYISEGLSGVIDTRYAQPAGRIQVVDKPETDPKAKAANTLKVEGKTVKVKYKQLKKKSKVLKRIRVIKFKKRGQGKKSYKLYSAKKGKKNFRKYFKVNKKNGNITVKKGLKKGTYKVKAKVRAAGDAHYEPSAWKTATIRIEVR